jgi:hypothetical protein
MSLECQVQESRGKACNDLSFFSSSKKIMHPTLLSLSPSLSLPPSLSLIYIYIYIYISITSPHKSTAYFLGFQRFTSSEFYFSLKQQRILLALKLFTKKQNILLLFGVNILTGFTWNP